MTSARRRPKQSTAGFTLLEALLTLALMGLILGALATITAQWLPNWNRGIARVQGHERLALGLERIAADLAAAEFIPVGREAREAFFDGTDRSVTFVRTAIGPNAGVGLEVVRIAETAGSGPNTVRMRAPFAPGIPAITYLREAKFGDPVVLLRASTRLAFSYAGTDRVWRDAWRERFVLPKAIRLTVRDAATRRTLSVSTATPVHVELPMDCVAAASLAACLSSRLPKADAGQDRQSRS
jgi:general secretion pathway protein J